MERPYLLIVFLSYLNPRGFPRAIPLVLFPLPLLPRINPPRTLLFGISPPPRLLSLELGRGIGAGVANLVVFLEEGGLLTKEVSVVMKVSSPKSGRELWSVVPCACSSALLLARLKDSVVGA